MSAPFLRWVLPDGASEPLGELVVRLGPTAKDALAEGRVFVDGRRASDPTLGVVGGNVVEVHAARAVPAGVAILAEHAGLVFANKPPGVATEPDHAGVTHSLVARVAELLNVPRDELHALSRLDVGVSGVVTLARDAAGRRLVDELRARGAFARRYLALAPHAPEPASGAWRWALSRHVRGAPARQRANERTSANEPTPADERSRADERPAETRYAVVAVGGSVVLPSRAAATDTRPALLALAPVTGRTHQLRLHAARAGLPLLGDAAHGGAQRVALPNGGVRPLERVALHAAWVELELDARRLHVEAPLPDDLGTLWHELGGAPEAWQRGLEMALASSGGPPGDRLDDA